jgi:diaminopimelate epimerase
MRFAKGHGTQNDFVILLDPDGAVGLTAGLVTRLCDRRAGIGGDGVLRAVRTAALDPAALGSAALGSAGQADWVPGAQSAPEWFMDYRNADGSLAEMCGNGIRVFARYLVERGLVRGPEFTVATRSGPRQLTLRADGDVTVGMGTVAVLGTGHAVVGGEACDGLRICVGNPHLACLVTRPLDGFDLTAPPKLDAGEFPEGGNVELVRVTGPGSAEVRVHERGSGETRSCGTGAVAAAAAAARAAGQDPAGQDPAGQDQGAWRLTLPGGELTVTLADGASWLTGPAVIVAEGELDPDWLGAAT